MKLQSSAEAPPSWHSERLHSRLARSSLPEGDCRACEKAQDEANHRPLRAQGNSLRGQSGAHVLQEPSLERACAQRFAPRPCRATWVPDVHCGHGGQAQVTNDYRTAHWVSWHTSHKNAKEPCAPFTLRLPLAFYEEAAAQRVSRLAEHPVASTTKGTNLQDMQDSLAQALDRLGIDRKVSDRHKPARQR